MHRIVNDITHKFNHLGTKLDVNSSSHGCVMVKLSIVNCGSSKLSLVKTIKYFTGLGLKDSKSVVDECDVCIPMIRIYLNSDEINQLREELFKIKCEFYLSGIDKIRNKRLIELGICDKQGLIDEISDVFISKFIDYNDSKVILRKVLEYLTEDQLKEIYNESNSYPMKTGIKLQSE